MIMEYNSQDFIKEHEVEYIIDSIRRSIIPGEYGLRSIEQIANRVTLHYIDKKIEEVLRRLKE